MPGPGGVSNQPACTVAAIEIVLTAWTKLERAEAKKRERK